MKSVGLAKHQELLRIDKFHRSLGVTTGYALISVLPALMAALGQRRQELT